MLIVELDGGYHRPSQPPLKGGDEAQWYNDPNQIERDKQRQDWLECQGYKVIRFTNEQILFDIDSVIRIVRQNLALQGR